MNYVFFFYFGLKLRTIYKERRGNDSPVSLQAEFESVPLPLLKINRFVNGMEKLLSCTFGGV